jgi:membrane protein implicated in regulation of membrane protease activity
MAIEIVFWHWWAFGALLLILELLISGMFFLWMAAAAVLIGALLLLIPAMDFEYQLIAFSLASVFSIVVFRKLLLRHPIETDRPLLNRRNEQYQGRVFTLEHPIVNGRGKIRVDDSTWKIEGEDCETGTKVKVIAADGVVLKVEIIDPKAK